MQKSNEDCNSMRKAIRELENRFARNTLDENCRFIGVEFRNGKFGNHWRA